MSSKSKITVRFCTFKVKLVTAFVSIGLVICVATGITVYQVSKEALKEAALNNLKAIRASKKLQIESYFDNIRRQAVTFARGETVVRAAREFKKSFHNLKHETGSQIKSRQKINKSLRSYYENEFIKKLNLNLQKKQFIDQYYPEDKKTVIAQYIYIANNIHKTGEKEKLVSSGIRSSYDKAHARHHPVIRDYKNKFGFYDIFILDPETGHVIYSVSKEVDFGTNLLSGPFKDSAIARLLKMAQSSTGTNFVKMEDFAPYGPSYLAPASFVATNIYDGKKKAGVLVFQMPVDEINKIMTFDDKWEENGLGKSGEVYLVGGDYKMRSTSRFLIEDPGGYFKALEESGYSISVIQKIKFYDTSIFLQEVNTRQVKSALRGETDEIIAFDYRGVSVVSAYSSLEIEDVNWGIISELDEEEAFEAVNYLFVFITIFTGFIIVLLVVFSLYYAKFLAKPVEALVNHSKALVDGKVDYHQRFHILSYDEVGDLSKNLNLLVGKMAKERDEWKKKEEEISHLGVSLLEQNSALEEEFKSIIENTGLAIEDLEFCLDRLKEGFETSVPSMANSLEKAERDNHSFQNTVRELNTSSLEIQQNIKTVEEVAKQVYHLNESMKTVSIQANTLISSIVLTASDIDAGSKSISTVGEVIQKETEDIREKSKELLSSPLGEKSGEHRELLNKVINATDRILLFTVNAQNDYDNIGKLGNTFVSIAKELKDMAKESTEVTKKVENYSGDLKHKCDYTNFIASHLLKKQGEIENFNKFSGKYVDQSAQELQKWKGGLDIALTRIRNSHKKVMAIKKRLQLSEQVSHKMTGKLKHLDAL